MVNGTLRLSIRSSNAMAVQFAKQRRDALLSQAGANVSGPRVMSLGTVTKPDPTRIGIKGLYLNMFKTSEAANAGPPSMDVIITGFILPQDVGQKVRCTDRADEVPAYERIDANTVRINVTRDNVKDDRGKWTQQHRSLDPPYILERNMPIRISAGNKDGSNPPRTPMSPLTLHNCSMTLWIPKAKADDGAAAASAPAPAVAPAPREDAPTAPTHGEGPAAGPVVVAPQIKRPGLFWKAEGVTYDDETGRSVPLEEMLPRFMPYETNVLPTEFDQLHRAKLVRPVKDEPPEGFASPCPLYRLGVNRWVREDVAGDPDAAHFVLPDEAFALKPPHIARGTVPSIHVNRVEIQVDEKKQQKGLRANLHALVDQYSSFDPANCITTTLAIKDLRVFADAYLTLGVTCWPLARAILFPSSGLPPLPYYVLLQPDIEKAPMSYFNNDGKEEAYDKHWPMVRAGPMFFRLAEYAHRFGIPVTAELILHRYYTAPQDQFVHLFSAEQREQPFQGNAKNPYAPIDWSRYTYTSMNNPGFIPLDGWSTTMPNERNFTSDMSTRFNFYALPIMDVTQAQLDYPLAAEEGKDDDDIEQLRHCTIKDAKEGTAFVVNAMRNHTKGNKALTSLPDDQFLAKADAWLLPVSVEATIKLRLPRWTFIALPRSYVPADPATYPQPSATAGIPATVPAGGTKRGRESDEDYKPNSPKQPRLDESGPSEDHREDGEEEEDEEDA